MTMVVWCASSTGVLFPWWMPLEWCWVVFAAQVYLFCLPVMFPVIRLRSGNVLFMSRFRFVVRSMNGMCFAISMRMNGNSPSTYVPTMVDPASRKKYAIHRMTSRFQDQLAVEVFALVTNRGTSPRVHLLVLSASHQKGTRNVKGWVDLFPDDAVLKDRAVTVVRVRRFKRRAVTEKVVIREISTGETRPRIARFETDARRSILSGGQLIFLDG
jgi:hypothetical protein